MTQVQKQFSGSSIDWEVLSMPLFLMGTDGDMKRAGTNNALVRQDNDAVLSVVTEAYEVFQNYDLYSKVEPMVEEGVLSLGNLGCLRGGKQVYIQAQVNKDYEVVGESYTGFLTVTNFHTGTGKAGLGTSMTRIVCENTFAAAHQELLKFAHINDGRADFLDSKLVMDFVDREMGIYAENAQLLASSPCSPGSFERFLKTVYRKESTADLRNVEKLNNLFYNGTGNEGKTFYDAINAITEFNTHHSRKSPEARFNYANFGTGAQVNSRAMAVALEMAGA